VSRPQYLETIASSLIDSAQNLHFFDFEKFLLGDLNAHISAKPNLEMSNRVKS
jgi:hypothetical protein